MAVSGLCMGCMSETGGAAICPQCGFDKRTAPVSPLYLPPRTVLQGRYTVGRVLGEGGFGITYLGWDATLAIRVAIKEFLPRELAARGADGRAISAYRGDRARRSSTAWRSFWRKRGCWRGSPSIRGSWRCGISSPLMAPAIW